MSADALPTPVLPPTIQGGAITDPEDKAFFAFWYGHMLNDLMQPPLSNVDHATARYIWNHARAALSSNHEDGGRAATDKKSARDTALEQAANLVECEYAENATQDRRLKQIAQHIRDLKKRNQS